VFFFRIFLILNDDSTQKVVGAAVQVVHFGHGGHGGGGKIGRVRRGTLDVHVLIVVVDTRGRNGRWR